MATDSGAEAVVRPDEWTGRSLDLLFDLLSDRRRRYALSCLADHERPLGLADLAREVADRENGAGSAAPHEDVEQVYTSLHHVHLPKLVEAGAVEYDRDHNVVRTSGATDAVERVRSFAVDASADL